MFHETLFPETSFIVYDSLYRPLQVRLTVAYEYHYYFYGIHPRVMIGRHFGRQDSMENEGSATGGKAVRNSQLWEFLKEISKFQIF